MLRYDARSSTWLACGCASEAAPSTPSASAAAAGLAQELCAP